MSQERVPERVPVKVERKLERCGTRMERKWNANGTQMEREWNANGTQMERKWNANGTRMERIFERVPNAFSVRLFLNSTVYEHRHGRVIMMHLSTLASQLFESLKEIAEIKVNYIYFAHQVIQN